MTILLSRGITLLIALVLIASSPRPAQTATAEDQEVQLGRSYARQLEARYKLITDRTLVERVAGVGREVAAASDRPQLPYIFKILDLDVPNAISLPGGFVYVTKALLTFIRSDHELAAVLAHEVAHAAHRHQMELIRRSNQTAFWTLVVAVLTQEPALAQGVQLVGLGLLSGYTRDMERDADLSAIAYLVKTDYTPVAVLTVMERLRRQEQLSAQPDPGAFRDHPRTEERVAYVTAELKRRGIPIVRRMAAGYLRVSTRVVTDRNHQVAELLVNDAVIVRLPDVKKIQAAAGALDRFFDTDPDPLQLDLLPSRDEWEIVGGRVLLLMVTSADAAYLGLSLDEAARTILSRLRVAIQQDRRMRQFNG